MGLTGSVPTQGLVPERERMMGARLLAQIVQTIQAARAGLTTSFFKAKYLGISMLMQEKSSLDPLAFPFCSSLTLLQHQYVKGADPLQVYMFTISSCHKSSEKGPVFGHSFAKWFLQAAKRDRLVLHVSFSNGNYLWCSSLR